MIYKRVLLTLHVPMYQRVHILILSLLMLMYTSVDSYCQQDTIKLYFRFDKYTVDSTYRTNAENIERISKILATPDLIQAMYMDVSTSPEGLQRHNYELADQRESGIKDYFVDLSGNKLDPETIHINLIKEDWNGLLEMVQEDYVRHDRDKLIYILTNKKLSEHEKWQIIEEMNEGYTFKVIQKNYFPVLRYANIYKIRWNPVQRLSGFGEDMIGADRMSEGEILPCPEFEVVKPELEPGFAANIRTNMLLDAIAIPNIGVEVHLGKRWSLGASWMCAWWDKSRENIFWRTYGGELNVRKYFGRQLKGVQLSGHHLGLYGHAFTYDLELSPKGEISYLTYGGGVEYGYSVPLSRRLNLDFSLGVGYLTGEYKLYEYDAGCYVWQETRQRHWIGPTKAEIALVLNIGKQNKR